MRKISIQEFYDRTGMTDCLENETAFCIAECPFHLDVPEFMNKIVHGSFHAAFRDFKNAVGFPRIALELCDERCRTVCPRKDKDSAVQMKLLERASVKYAKNIKPTQFNLPQKNIKVAVVGAGICGMSCALRLCEKKYHVDIYEKTGMIGGHLWEIMDPSIFLDDLKQQFMFEHYELHLNCDVQSVDSISSGYDAVFIATGKFGFKAEGKGIFTGGALLGMSDLDSLVYGLEVSKEIEAFLKTGVAIPKSNQPSTRLPLPDMGDVGIAFTEMGNPIDYGEEEAKQEASRCLQCKCSACTKHCDLLLQYKKTPFKAMEEVWATTEINGVLNKNMSVATKMISSCTQCGLCSEVCPSNIDFKTIMLEARRTLHKKGSLPWVFNDYFLRDMFHANNQAGVTIHPNSVEPAEYIFFPGCQMGASDPRYVADSYRLLLEHFPNTVLINRCCGAPAVWAGDEDLQNTVFGEFRTQWEQYHKPEVIFACPTCKKIFEEYLPDVKGEFLYTMLANLDIPMYADGSGCRASVFDPCNARNNREVQLSVRKLSEKAGYELTNLKYEMDMAKCCGYGGNIRIVNPNMADNIAERRMAQGTDMFITYCVNCRDIFAEHGKNAIHILDAVFGFRDDARPAPTISQRRRNRETLKAALLKEFYGETSATTATEKPNIIIDDGTRQMLHQNMMLEEDIVEVVKSCEANCCKVLNTKTDTFCGYKEIGYMTYWVEYRYVDNDIKLVDAYSHRITIEG